MGFHLESQAFQPRKSIPREYTGEGSNQSPPLHWEDAPPGTKELALICDDPDAPQDSPFVHWVLYKIPPDFQDLPTAIPNEERPEVPVPLVQGLNSFGKIGYGGPLPPKRHGTHHYHFRLYALDREMPERAGLDKEGLMQRMKPHILAETELVGTYTR